MRHVRSLKGLIVAQKPRHLDNIHADDLKLWKLSEPYVLDVDSEDESVVKNLDVVRDSPKSVAKVLHPAYPVSDYFNGSPPLCICLFRCLSLVLVVRIHSSNKSSPISQANAR